MLEIENKHILLQRITLVVYLFIIGTEVEFDRRPSHYGADGIPTCNELIWIQEPLHYTSMHGLKTVERYCQTQRYHQPHLPRRPEHNGLALQTGGRRIPDDQDNELSSTL